MNASVQTHVPYATHEGEDITSVKTSVIFRFRDAKRAAGAFALRAKEADQVALLRALAGEQLTALGMDVEAEALQAQAAVEREFAAVVAAAADDDGDSRGGGGGSSGGGGGVGGGGGGGGGGKSGSERRTRWPC